MNIVIFVFLSLLGFPVAADSGWLLVVPPKIHQMTDSEIDWLNASVAAFEDPVDRTLYHGGEILDKSASLADWRQVRAFETVALCEEDRSFRLRIMEREENAIRDKVGAGQTLTLQDVTALFTISLGRHARCVPVSAYYAD